MPNYPYSSSGQTAIVQTLSQLRKSFPNKIDAGYLQRFSIAPGNESYVISILRFLGLIDEDGNRVDNETGYFFDNDDLFKTGLEATLRSAYSQMFEEMGDGALDATKGELTQWFRASDKTSDLVGQRQASTFQALAALAGHGDLPTVRSGVTKKTVGTTQGSAVQKTTDKKTASKQETESPREVGISGKNGKDVGLTVRIEVNLPPGGDADTYDAIFASIKKHLMS